jgi:hypothetical protein
MIIMNYRAEYWRNKLDELEKRVTSDKYIPKSKEKVIEWASDCIAVFTALGVEPAIIEGFMKFFENWAHDYINDLILRQQVEYWSNPSRMADRIKGFFYPNVAFKAARTVLDSLSEQERLVPQVMVDFFRQKEDCGHIASSLETIESTFQSKDPESLLSASVSLLQCILDSELALSEERNLKAKLQKLIQNPEVRDKFGVDIELLGLLDTARWLRNKTAEHKEEYSLKPSFIGALGYSTLVLNFLSASMSKGLFN